MSLLLHLRLCVLYAIAINCVLCETFVYDERNTNNNNAIEVSEAPPTFTWLKSAKDMMTSPAGHVVVQMAKELLNRSAGNSQVLSLNLTNLLIIVLLKVLIFAAGMLGAGHWSSYGYGYGRSLDTEINKTGFNLFNDGEDYLITGFLAAQGAGLDDCLYAASCASPVLAYEYAKAAKALFEGIEKFEGNPVKNPRYYDLIELVERAAYDGYRGIPCNTTMQCDGLL